MQMNPIAVATAFGVVERLPPALVEFIDGVEVDARLLAKARSSGLPANIAPTACAVLQRVIQCLDSAGRKPRGTFARVKLLETALDACREPTASALRLGMVASPVDGRAMLRLWTEVCDRHEKGRMLEMLSVDMSVQMV